MPITGISLSEQIPDAFQLFQNYPNPFNPETSIGYVLPKAGQVKLKIYNISGEEVRRLVDRNQPTGNYAIIWDGNNDTGESVSSGVYFYKLTTGGSFLATRKMLFLK